VVEKADPTGAGIRARPPACLRKVEKREIRETPAIIELFEGARVNDRNN